jgi:hypothetical protein
MRNLTRCSQCHSLNYDEEYSVTAKGKRRKVCLFCENQKKLEIKFARPKKPRPLLTMLRNIDPELRKVEATLRQSTRRHASTQIRISQNISHGIYQSLACVGKPLLDTMSKPL